MSNAITLPEPDGSAEANQRPHPGGGYEYDEVPAWSEPLVHAHAAAVTAAKDAEIAQLRADNTRLQNDVVMPLRERVRVLEDALRMALAELDELPVWSNTGHICNAARAALGDKTPTTPLPSPSPRS